MIDFSEYDVLGICLGRLDSGSVVRFVYPDPGTFASRRIREVVGDGRSWVVDIVVAFRRPGELRANSAPAWEGNVASALGAVCNCSPTVLAAGAVQVAPDPPGCGFVIGNEELCEMMTFAGAFWKGVPAALNVAPGRDQPYFITEAGRKDWVGKGLLGRGGISLASGIATDPGKLKPMSVKDPKAPPPTTIGPQPGTPGTPGALPAAVPGGRTLVMVMFGFIGFMAWLKWSEMRQG
jgi:hypothetical protein